VLFGLTISLFLSFYLMLIHSLLSVGVLVFRLRSSTTVPPPPNTNTTVFAVASLEATESVATAHERDMVQWREMVEDGRYVNGSASANGGSEEPCRSIAPADGILELKDHRPNKTHVVAEQRSPAGPISNRSSSHKAKAVTAASFFASQTKQKQKQKSSSTSSTSEPTVEPKKADTMNQPSKKGAAVSSKQEAPSVVPKPTREKENKVRKNRVVAPTTATTTTKKGIGNADDFVADEEDSEDDDVEVVLPKSSKVRTKPTPPPSPEPQEPASPVRGAMDAFTTTTTTSTKNKTNRQTAQTTSTEPNGGGGPTRQRKRQKKLVEKTSLVNGYLRNETQVVWEDVPTDEEEEEKAPSSASNSRNHHNKMTKKAAVPGPSKNPQGMKQKSLMGFFSKKK
jgi:hypothetical protein